MPILYDVTSGLLQIYWLKHVDNVNRLALPGDEYYQRVQEYNASVTGANLVSVTRRAEALFPVLGAPPRDVTAEKLLLIGPRNVQELFTAWLYGFSWKNITAIDLYATHPKIQVMNMEAMTFANGTFDAILMSNTLAYAKDVRTCLAECARVLRPGGTLVFGQTFCPDAREYAGNRVSGSATAGYLKDIGLIPYYYHQTEKTNRLGFRQTYHVFGVRKPDAARDAFDPVRWN